MNLSNPWNETNCLMPLKQKWLFGESVLLKVEFVWFEPVACLPTRDFKYSPVAFSGMWSEAISKTAFFAQLPSVEAARLKSWTKYLGYWKSQKLLQYSAAILRKTSDFYELCKVT